jgi:hypothetical protein
MTLFERILNENKDRFIATNDNLTQEEKSEIMNFFRSHPNYEKYIDWQKSKSLGVGDFQQVIEKAKNSKSARETESKNGSLGAIFRGEDVEILKESDNEIFATPLSWHGAKFMDSFNCYGKGAKWCIGDSNNQKFWKDYVDGRYDCFIFYYNKSAGSKWMIQYQETGKYMLWDATDDAMMNDYDGDDQLLATDVIDILRHYCKNVQTTIEELKEFAQQVGKIYDEKNVRKTLKAHIEIRLAIDKALAEKIGSYADAKSLASIFWNMLVYTGVFGFINGTKAENILGKSWTPDHPESEKPEAAGIFLGETLYKQEVIEFLKVYKTEKVDIVNLLENTINDLQEKIYQKLFKKYKYCFSGYFSIEPFGKNASRIKQEALFESVLFRSI